MRILVTGATGFLGGLLLHTLRSKPDHQVFGSCRSVRYVGAEFPLINVGEIAATTDWTDGVRHQDVVIHTAARVHVMTEQASDPLVEFRKVNVEGTLNLARQAAAAGVRRFIFISSIKVNGEESELGYPYTADDAPAPVEPYGISKLEAEQGLVALSVETGMEVVIIRPVLIYGPGVKANFYSMMKWLNNGVPLPLGSINNKRSLVALDNLIDLIINCIDNPAAANQIFLVSDDEDLSTTALFHRMGKALNKSARLLPMPKSSLTAVTTLLGKRSMAQRLCGSLQVDINKTRKILGWAPPVAVDYALSKTAIYFLKN